MVTQSDLISKNNPTTQKKYTFLLDSYALKFAPDGWENDEYIMTRDMKLFGVFRKFAISELKFVKDGRDYLRDVYEAGGVNSVCMFTVNELLTTGLTRNRFIGYIDFSTYKITELSVDVAVIDGAFTDTVLTRSETEVDLMGVKSVDGAGSLPPDFKTITIPEIIINQIANWKGSETADHTGFYYPPMAVIKSEFGESKEVKALQDFFFIDAVEDYTGVTFNFKLDLTLDGIPGPPDAEYNVEVFVQRYNGGVYVEHVYSSSKLMVGVFPYNETIENTATFDIATGDSFKLMVQVTNLAGAGKITATAVECKLLNQAAAIAERTFHGLFAHEAFERVIQLYTGFSGRFKSDFFGRTDIGYSVDGILNAITSGRYLRQNWGLNSTIPASLEKLFASEQAIYCLGMGVELIGGVEKVVVEELSHFFNNLIVLDVSDRIAPETVEKVYAPELSFNRISAGYNSYDYLQLGGIYEFNTTSKFTTVIKPVDKELNIVSPYRADMSGVITLINEPSENKDVSGEGDIFLLDAIRDGEAYKLRTVEDFEQSEDLSNRDILINLNISPKRNLLRWGAYLRGFLEKYLDSLIIWQTSDKNTKLSSTESGQSTVTENTDILVSDLATPLWHPETFTIEVPSKESDIDYIKANPYGIVKLSATEYGWILNYKSHNENHKSEFKLLRVNTNYVTPGPVPIVPPITSLVITKQVIGNSADNTTFAVKIWRFGDETPMIYSLTQQEPIIINQIGYGNYLVEEIPIDGYNLETITPASFIIGASNLNQVVEIVNNNDNGRLTINKTITGLPDDETFFHVVVTGQREIDPAIFEGDVSQSQPLTFENIPFDEYVITETAQDKYSLVSITPEAISIDPHNPHGVVEIVNDKLPDITPIKYGALYHQTAASKNGGSGVGSIAPDGWHVPTSAEWVEFWGAFDVPSNLNYFNRMLCGDRGAWNGSFNGIDTIGIFASSSAFTCYVYSPDYPYYYGNDLAGYGVSARCIKNTSDWTEGETVTDIDGNIYPTTKIGNQVWMAANLAVTKYNDGTPIPNVTDNAAWAALTTGAYCWYDNDINNK